MTDPTSDSDRAWSECFGMASPDTRANVEALVTRSATELADLFYQTMLGDPQAGQFLDHALVNRRLHGSMERWLHELFTIGAPLAEIHATQRRAGEAHARIGVPIDLVAHGGRVLKRAIAARIAAGDLPRPDLAQGVEYVYEMIDIAIDTMNSVCASNTARMARSDEAYRVFFLGQNMKAERERQKAQLLEWAHEILARYYWDTTTQTPGRPADGLADSQFGLWLHHKASILFEGAPEVARIEAAVARIETDIVPRLGRARASHEDARELVARLNRHVDEIKALLGTMFDRLIEAEDGHDGVTRLLNRRYVPSVAKREIALAQRNGTGFAMLMLDLDRFRALQDVLGLEGSDAALAQVADALIDSVRAGDFVFRVGDDQFLVLLVEANRAAVLAIADHLRERVGTLKIRSSTQVSATLTASIGIALFDGHPDYQRMLDRAEEALREAKVAGRNRCAIAA